MNVQSNAKCKGANRRIVLPSNVVKEDMLERFINAYSGQYHRFRHGSIVLSNEVLSRRFVFTLDTMTARKPQECV
jgi:hypothetical protein